MRIATHSVTDAMVRQIQQLGSQQARLQNQVATGQRLFQPEDDPVGVGRLLNLETEQRQLAQFTRNADRAMEISQATFSGLQALKRASDRASELGTLGSGAASPDAMRAYALEVDQLLEQALQSANAKLGNDYLYAGTAVDSPPFVATRDALGQIISVDYVGDAAQMSVPLSASSNLAPGSSGETNLGLRDFLNALVGLRTGLAAADTVAVTAAQNQLLPAEDGLIGALAGSGGVQARVEAERDWQQEHALRLETLVSKEADADLPATIVKLTQSQNAYQAALQSAASLMKTSLLDYLR